MILQIVFELFSRKFYSQMSGLASLFRVSVWRELIDKWKLRLPIKDSTGY